MINTLKEVYYTVNTPVFTSQIKVINTENWRNIIKFPPVFTSQIKVINTMKDRKYSSVFPVFTSQIKVINTAIPGAV